MSNEEDDDWDDPPSRAGLGGRLTASPRPAPPTVPKKPSLSNSPPPPSKNYSAADYLRSALQAKPRGGAKRGERSSGHVGGGRSALHGNVGTASDSDDGVRFRGLGGGGSKDRVAGSDDDDEYDDDESDAWDPDGDDAFALPDTFGGGARWRRKRRREESTEGGDHAGGVGPDVDVELGAWEQHTKGVGSKLLQKMGFTGRLGLREDGITKPIVARVRPEKSGIGAGKFVEKTEEETQMDEVMERNLNTGVGDGDKGGEKFGEEREQGRGEGGKRWQKDGAKVRQGARRKKASKSKLKLVDLTGASYKQNIGSDRASGEGNEAFPAVLDLRGVDAVEAESVAEALLRGDADEASHAGTQGPFDVPEVIFNVRMLQSAAKSDVEVAVRKRATEEMLRSNAALERERIAKSLTDAKDDLRDAQSLQSELSGFLTAAKVAGKAAKLEKKRMKATRRAERDGDEPGGVLLDGNNEPLRPEHNDSKVDAGTSLAEFVKVLRKFTASEAVQGELRKRTHDPYGIRESLSAIAEARAGPLAGDLLAIAGGKAGYGNPAAVGGKSSYGSASELCALLTATQGVLGARDTSEGYMRLVCRVVFNPLRRAVGARWNAREPDRMVELMDSLVLVLPAALSSSFAEEMLVPRLLREVEAWTWSNAADFGTPFHLWIFPWLPVVGKRPLAPVFSAVRQKITSMLRWWAMHEAAAIGNMSRRERPADVISHVSPWGEVLSQGKLQGALARHIAPVLQSALQREFNEDNLPKYSPSSVCPPPACASLDEVLVWRGVMDEAALGKILLVGLFPALVVALHQHLFQFVEDCAGLPVAAASAAAWYEAWRDRIPEGLSLHIRPGLAALLFVMHASSKQSTDPIARKKLACSDTRLLLRNGYIVPPKRNVKARATEKHAAERPVLISSGQGRRATLRDVVRSIATREGLAFHDEGRVTNDGRQLYVFGETSVVLDGARQLVLADCRAGSAGGVDGRLVAVDMQTLARLGRGEKL